MKVKTISIAILALFCLALGSALAAEPSATYKAKCAACHGADGTGSTPMGKKLAVKSLQSPDVQKLTDDELSEKIAKGKGKMPAFEKKLNADEIKSIVAFIRTFAKK